MQDITVTPPFPCVAVQWSCNALRQQALQLCRTALHTFGYHSQLSEYDVQPVLLLKVHLDINTTTRHTDRGEKDPYLQALIHFFHVVLNTAQLAFYELTGSHQTL